MKNKKIIVLMFLAIYLVVCLTGCGEKGIEGTWILVKEIMADGEILNESDLKDLGISEEYVIEGSVIQYTLNTTMVKKPITMELTLEEAGDKQYIFKIKELTFAEVKLDGDTFSYYSGEGESRTKMIFERKR